jgi:hypothetical protein
LSFSLATLYLGILVLLEKPVDVSIGFTL